jgi:hypothetical protein
MEAGCDVYQRAHFLDGLVLVNSIDAPSALVLGLRRHLDALGTQWLGILRNQDIRDQLPPGPYLYLDGALKPVYRLYDDVQGAFLTALKPKPNR